MIRMPESMYLKLAWVFLSYAGVWSTDNPEHAAGQGREKSHHGLWLKPLLFLQVGFMCATLKALSDTSLKP